MAAVDLTGLPGAMDGWRKHFVFPPPAHNPLENAGRFPQPLGKPEAGFPQLHNRDDDDRQDSYVNGGIPPSFPKGVDFPVRGPKARGPGQFRARARARRRARDYVSQ